MVLKLIHDLEILLHYRLDIPRPLPLSARAAVPGGAFGPGFCWCQICVSINLYTAL